MNKFLFKSTTADLSKMLSILETLQKNVLYLTYRIDTVLKNTSKMVIDKDLQSQVDEYFDEDGSSKTPPQTDTGHKRPELDPDEL